VTGYEAVVTIVMGLVILIGVAGTFLPILPGLFLVWAAVIAYGLLLDFGVVGWIAVALVTALLVLGLYLNIRIPQKSAAESGLRLPAQLFGLALAIAGFFIVPVVGFPLGFVLGVYIVRYRATNDASQAWTSTKQGIAAIIRASAVQAACGIGMFLVWLGWALIR